MSGVNPVVMIQMLMNYHQQGLDSTAKRYFMPRTFAFQHNNRMRVHRETEDETKRRKSRLDVSTCKAAERVIRSQLEKTLKGRIGKVWIDPDLERVAVPLETATGNSGFGILPTGSRIKIPEGKFIRAFTYWEKVNDIDLSVFALTEKGEQEEFSWRNMYRKQGTDITYSGDQTSGYEGGSEYFDINVQEFAAIHPEYRYLIFCNNVYSGIDFSECECYAGFMIREEDPKKVPSWKGERETNVPLFNGEKDRDILAGEIFDPKTVQTSYRIDNKGTFSYLFAIDLETREMVWLNIMRSDRVRVAGTTGVDWLTKYLNMVDVFNLRDLYSMAGTLVYSAQNADVIVSDRNVSTFSDNPSIEYVHSWDFEKMLSLLQSGS